jgi:hypothetical protein
MGFPSPATDRLLWYSCVIGDYILPPTPTCRPTGTVVIEAESGGKKDKKKAAGANKSKTTKQGKEDVKIKIKCEFTAEGWEDGEGGAGWDTILAAIDPNGDATGGPFAFSHPDTDRRGVKSIMVDKIGKVEWKGHHGSVEIDCSEWTDPATANTGGATKTPDKDAATPKNTQSTGSGGGGGVPKGQVVGADGFDPVVNPAAPTPAP